MTLVLRFTPNDSCSWALAANWQQNRTTSRGLLQIEGTVQNKGEQWDTWDFCQEYSCVSAFIAKSMQTPGD